MVVTLRVGCGDQLDAFELAQHSGMMAAHHT
jgi:hypothetical protein